MSHELFDSNSNKLIGFLVRKAREEERDRALLARLRNSLRPGRELEALSAVLPFVHETSMQDTERQENAALLTAGLFALHPQHAAGRSHSLGSALRRISAGTPGGSTELRFQALLASTRRDLATHLRYAVQLVAGHGEHLPLDYGDLHAAIYYWDHPRQHSRRQWARDFWNASSSASAAS